MFNLLRALKFLFLPAHRKPIELARAAGVRIGKGCRFVGCNDFGSEPYLIELGDHVSLTNVTFINHDGGVWVFRKAEPDIDVVRPIKVGCNVFIGHGVVMMPGVTVGDNVVIGAYSVVTKNIPSNTVVAGVPARFIKSIDDYRSGMEPHVTQTKKMAPLDKRNYFLSKFSS
ncbi:acyltransferase [Neiella marina]|uniref:Acyltransferase n=1 Tax=Neiella holothuriorum TaxID=2870530 RepID=A0ABS7EH07_9GAMM|nr:acyltransferase [Neiella holothuriorum]MBW8191631.1 acyltransferase [Neiella holothuriorum]